MSVWLPSHILGQAQGKYTRHVVSVSGGKDSTATYLLALEQTGGDFDAVFADTGNEHEATYEPDLFRQAFHFSTFAGQRACFLAASVLFVRNI